MSQSDQPALTMSSDELQGYYREMQSQSGDGGARVTVDMLNAGGLKFRAEVGDRFTRPGGTVSGPALFALVDSAGWMLAVAHRGPGSDAFTTDISMEFLRPVSMGTVVVESTVLRLGRRSVFEVVIDPRPGGPAVHGVVGFATRGSAQPPVPD